MDVRIGEAAARLGLEAHVLRHWEEQRVVVPPRTSNGYRDYDDEAMVRLRVVLACRDAGMSLAQVRLVLHHGAQGRSAVIDERIERIGTQLHELGRTREFLRHVLTCRHDLMSRCADCTPPVGPPSPPQPAVAGSSAP